jgi:PKD repeat protein
VYLNYFTDDFDFYLILQTKFSTMRHLIILPLFFIQLFIFAQSSENMQIISINHVDNGIHFKSEYQVLGAINFNTVSVNNTLMQIPYIKGTGYLQQAGKPALPSFAEIFAIYSDSINVKFNSIDRDTIHNIIIYPWIGHAVDLQGIQSPEFFIDTAFYNLDTEYPVQNALITEHQSMRGQQLAIVRICPFTYNPQKKILVIHKRFTIEVLQNKKRFFTPKSSPNPVTSKILKNITRNKLHSGLHGLKSNQLENAQNYLIITHPDYIEAAQLIANWREQTGYRTEILTSLSWLSASISQAIFDRYHNQNQLSYVLLLGDHNKVPGYSLISHLGVFPTDRPYVCMDGLNDYFPDIAVGRISVNSSQQAMNVVEKIINYEKNPVMQPGFYNNALSVAYFQDDNNNNYADRRFAQTAEEILQYLTTHAGKNVTRIYYTNSSITPLYWNNTYYSAGEPVPTHLLKPGFPWNGNSSHIISNINNGSFLVYHRDHGSDQGWGDPAFNISNVQSLSNGNKLPIVASVNCQTGKFLTTECFAEAFLRQSQGGAAGVFAHAEVSYSGYNDALSMGIIDAIFAQPGLISNFTGSGHTSGTITQHDQILTLGDVTDQALLRMTQTWGDSWGYEKYQHNIFHYFGDPATRIFTELPLELIAIHQNSIHCSDTLFSIYSCNIQDAQATLTADGQLIGLTFLQNGSGMINFKQTASNNILLTISAPNSKPYIQHIVSTGNCVFADFEVSAPANPCVGHSVTFKNLSSGYYNNIIWDFGQGATPQTIIGEGPHSVHYSSSGIKSVTLIAVSPLGNDTMSLQVYINSACNFAMPPFGLNSIQSCSGILKDNGNDLPYLSGSDSQVLIYSPGATQIQLNFTTFDVQGSAGCNDHYLEIYSGNPLTGNLIGKFCNSNPAPAQLLINNDSVGLYFYSGQNAGFQGFEVSWECIQPMTEPLAGFNYEFSDHCGHIIQFLDNSLFLPDHWLWDFGDGNTSNLQHPEHEYFLNGTYDVQLIAGNVHGSNTILYPGLIIINRPQYLNDSTFSICRPGNIQIPGGNGQAVLWFDNENSLQSLAYTDVLNFYANQSLTNIYCRNFITNGSHSGGKPDNSGVGGYFNSSVIHFLGFDVYQPLNLKAVTVYAQDNGNRTIRIRDGNNNMIHTSTHYLTTGLNRVELNCILLPDNDYKIDAGQYCKLYRNGESGGNNLNYPFTIPGFLSINRSSAGYPNASKYYYFFYDWEVESLCFSAPAKKEIKVEIADTTITAWPGFSLCNGDSILLTGMNQGSYLWLPCGDTTNFMFVNSSGLYSAMIENNGCVATTNSIIIEGEIFPHAAFSYSMNGFEITFTNTSTGSNFMWLFGDGNESFDEHPVHAYSQAGTYNVTLIAQNSCGSDSASILITISETGLPENFDNTLTIFPNPANDQIFINFMNLNDSQIKEIKIFNVTNQLISVCEIDHLNDNILTVPVHHFASGIYFAVIQTDTGLFYGKFIKTNTD